MTIRIKVENKELLKKLEKMKNKAQKVIEEAFKESADIVVEEAKSRAPFKTGTLKKAIARDEPKITKGKVSINIGIEMKKPFGKPDSYYARFQEFGTSKMRASPYLRPALDHKKNEVVAKFIEVLKRLIKK